MCSFPKYLWISIMGQHRFRDWWEGDSGGYGFPHPCPYGAFSLVKGLGSCFPFKSSLLYLSKVPCWIKSLSSSLPWHSSWWSTLQKRRTPAFLKLFNPSWNILGEVVLLTQQTKQEEIENPYMSGKYRSCPKPEGDLFKAVNVGEVKKGPRFLGSHFMTLWQEWNLLKVQKHSKNLKTLLKTQVLSFHSKKLSLQDSIACPHWVCVFPATILALGQLPYTEWTLNIVV